MMKKIILKQVKGTLAILSILVIFGFNQKNLGLKNNLKYQKKTKTQANVARIDLTPPLEMKFALGVFILIEKYTVISIQKYTIFNK